MNKTVDPFEYCGTIIRSMKRGILLTTKEKEKVNTMTIGWGTIGIEWGKPVFIAYVRDSRHTREILDRSSEFTISVPYGEADAEIMKFCGTKSGRDTDKIRQLGLHLEPSEVNSVPGIRELPLTLECRVLYHQTQEAIKLPDDVQKRFYPAGEQGQDEHIAYYGEIVNAHLICD